MVGTDRARDDLEVVARFLAAHRLIVIERAQEFPMALLRSLPFAVKLGQGVAVHLVEVVQGRGVDLEFRRA